MNVDQFGVPAEWLDEHVWAATLATPVGALGDVGPLADIVGDARVVAIGEGAHFVQEFSAIREQVARQLAERCGFGVFAFEYSFVDGEALDRWLAGQDDRPLAEVSPTAAHWGAADLMAGLRQHNRTSLSPLRFVGIDLAEAGGALRPVLEPLQGFLADNDPTAVALVRTARELSDAFLGQAGSGAAAASRWAQLPRAKQDALTASLARLHQRVRAIGPEVDARRASHDWAVAERCAACACATDHMFGAMHALLSGAGVVADLSVRDRFMAETVRWHLERSGPSARLILAAHNNHIQKTPNVFDEKTASIPMGAHLAEMLGEDYVAIAVTHTADRVPEMRPDQTAPVGFVVEDAVLPDPPPSSIEAALIHAGLASQLTLTDLHQAPTTPDGRPLLRQIRTQTAYMDAPLDTAFDAVIATPTATRDPAVRF